MDRKLSWIGSFNPDPRSSRLNTEMAVLIDSASLGADLAESMERDLAPDRSWRVMIQPGSRQLVWQRQHDGQETTCRREPDTSWWLRAWVRIARRFPYIERFL